MVQPFPSNYVALKGSRTPSHRFDGLYSSPAEANPVIGLGTVLYLFQSSRSRTSFCSVSTLMRRQALDMGHASRRVGALLPTAIPAITTTRGPDELTWADVLRVVTSMHPVFAMGHVGQP
jgi:hypothetical protein